MAPGMNYNSSDVFLLIVGVAANCASALAQMAAASCVQEEKEERDAQEPSDAIAQGMTSQMLSGSQSRYS